MNEPSDDPLVDGVFVYGTLKRGQCRSSLWPRSPIEVRAAWIYGRLYCRDDYPALKSGCDRVLGELWRFAAADIPLTLVVLDQIEGFNQGPGANLYERKVVQTCCGGFEERSLPSSELNASSYLTTDSDKASDPLTVSESNIRLGISQAYAYFYARDPILDGFVRMTSPAYWPAE